MVTQYHARQQKFPKGFQIFEQFWDPGDSQDWDPEDSQDWDPGDSQDASPVVDFIEDFRKDAIAFVRSKNKWLELELDDSDIAVVGCSKGFFGIKRRRIGDVEVSLASKILEGGWFDKIKPRLYKTVVTDDGCVMVGFQILGPKAQFWEWNPVDTENAKEKIESEGGSTYLYEDAIKKLKAEKRYEEAIELLLRLIEQAEKELPPIDYLPYYHLATIYRRQKKYKEEVELLERYDKTKRAKDAINRLGERLVKARTLLSKTQPSENALS